MRSRTRLPSVTPWTFPPEAPTTTPPPDKPVATAQNNYVHTRTESRSIFVTCVCFQPHQHESGINPSGT